MEKFEIIVRYFDYDLFISYYFKKNVYCTRRYESPLSLRQTSIFGALFLRKISSNPNINIIYEQFERK